ncbi:MAG TPA: YjgB family protein [Verrucomicrobiae bacterium]|nr:YjgB family protein [Verrucomicrobiae bacterium]
MKRLFQPVAALVIIAVTISLLAGCTGDGSKKVSPGPQNSVSDSLPAPSPDQNPNPNPNPNPSPTTPAPASPSPDAPKALLSDMRQLARQGKVINCEYAVKTTVLETVVAKWGEPDKTDWVPAAKGNYATYQEHGMVFGINKGQQIFEVRTFDSQLRKLSLAKVKEILGNPAYDNKYAGEQIIGYTAGTEFKLLMVFPQPTNTNTDPFMDHYSVLYPQGTVNSMANDPGRQW